MYQVTNITQHFDSINRYHAIFTLIAHDDEGERFLINFRLGMVDRAGEVVMLNISYVGTSTSIHGVSFEFLRHATREGFVDQLQEILHKTKLSDAMLNGSMEKSIVGKIIEAYGHFGVLHFAGLE